MDAWVEECRWVGEDGRSGNVIWYACRYNALMEVIVRLIEAGVDPNDNVQPRTYERQFDPGHEPVKYAICHGNVPLVHLLLSHGADIHQVVYLLVGPSWPLHVASFAGPVELVQLLLEHGADPMGRDRCQRTPLHFAVGIPDYRRCVNHEDPYTPKLTKEVWYESRIKFDECNGIPDVPAAEPQEREKIIKLLLEYGANPTTQTRQGLKPLVAPYFKTDSTTGKAEYMLQDTERMMQEMRS